MQNSKLIELLKTFSAKELRECGDFVCSPFFNYDEEIIALYNYLRKLAHNFSPKKIERETVYKNLFPKKRYDDTHLNYLMSFLLKLIEQYIGYSQYAGNPVLENINVLQSYMKRGLDKHFHNIHKLAKNRLDTYPHRNLEFFYLQHLLSEVDNRNFLRKNIRKFDARLQSAADYFDLYLLARKLKYFVEMQDRKMTLSADYKLNMQQEISDYIARNDFSAHPGIQAYCIVLQTQEKPDETKHFFELRRLLKKHHIVFPEEELRELYSYAINYCLRRVNIGRQEFLKELFSLYKETLKSGLMLENGQISFWSYKNIIGVALRLREFDWAEKFIRDENDKLAEEFRDNALHYNLAELSFYRHDFDATMIHLNKVEFSDIYYSFDTKKMMMKIYFEKGEIDALLSLINSFKTFIRRNQSISESNKVAYENFILVINQFLKHAQQRTAPELLDNIQNLKPLADRSWLMEQYNKNFKT